MSAMLNVFPPAAQPTINPIAVAFEKLKLPWLIEHQRSRDTIQQYRLSVSRWVKYWEFCWEKYRTAHPVLAELRTSDFESWRSWLLEIGCTARTANKAVGDVLSIMSRCESVGRDELSCRHVPAVYRLRERRIAPKLYFRFLTRPECATLRRTRSPAVRLQLADLDELSALHRACEHARWPTRLRDGSAASPVVQWQAAIVLFCLYGFRTRELIRLNASDPPGLQWSQVSFDRVCPLAESHAINAQGWLWYTPAKQAWVKPEPLCLPIAPVARVHLERILPISQRIAPGGGLGPVFNWPLSTDSCYSTWRQIVGQLQVRRDLATGLVIDRQLKHLRKTCTTWHNHFWPGIGPHVTGHAPRGEARISVGHYDNAELAVVEAMRNLPVPASWATGSRT